jgi:hypothetical protein
MKAFSGYATFPGTDVSWFLGMDVVATEAVRYAVLIDERAPPIPPTPD